MEALIPPWVKPETPEKLRFLDDGSTVFQPQFFRGNAQTQLWSDPRWQLLRRYKAMRLEERGMLETALNDARGKGLNIRLVPHRPLRGSFPTSELLTNTSFESDSSTGWQASGSGASILALDRRLRVIREAVTNATVRRSSAATVVSGAPYCARAFMREGKGVQGWSVDIGSAATLSDYAASGTYTDQVLGMSSGVALSTSAFFNMLAAASTKTNGDFDELVYASLARCALVDNTSNFVLRGGQLDNAAWTATNLTVTASAATAPNNQAIAESLMETAVNNVHHITQTLTVPATTGIDITIGAAFKPNGRNFVRMILFDNVSTDFVSAYFNISTGVVGTTQTSGTVYTNLRTSIESMGDGWYACYLTGRKTTAITAPVLSLRVASADGTQSYLGVITNGVYGWGVTGTAGGVPMRLAAASSTTVTTDTVQSGKGMYIKGLPASTNGLLLPGDWVGINGEIKQVTQPLNSSAAGLGFLKFAPSLVNAPADNTAVEIFEPFGRYKLMNGADLDNLFGLYTDCELELTEVYA